MSEERIKLPDFIIADIYKKHLVEPLFFNSKEQEKKVVSEVNFKNEKGTSLHFLGDNRKHISVLVFEQNAKFINEAALAFLTKVLGACNLNLADIAIVNTYNAITTFDKLKKELNVRYILLLGVEPTAIKLPFTVPNFQVQQFSDCTIVSAPALINMMNENAESVALKRQLWGSLQKVFKLK